MFGSRRDEESSVDTNEANIDVADNGSMSEKFEDKGGGDRGLLTVDNGVIGLVGEIAFRLLFLRSDLGVVIA